MAVGLIAGLALGLAAAVTRSPLLLSVSGLLRPVGTLFLNLLSMVVIPLVVTALFLGVAGLGDVGRVGRLGVRTLGFFCATTIVAILIGFGVAALLLPLAPVTPDQQAKSISHEVTFPQDVPELETLRRVILHQTEDVAYRLRRLALLARTITLKIRLGDFTTLTRGATLPEPSHHTADLWRAARDLLTTWHRSGAIR